ncbi:hypothetical protein CKM354_001019600 [Cercospora kikuchii]|uniref:Uncharacterized protein n=1 Tax=Cercospora kikuchii TaxID=84275 RepID=A0A9P3CWI8_9PEZI|nr:uncharacterized protein CKM354_001019600 [Cercospora kikuchii]GIZ47095.1 hypothetical protein CKM354_001019600 [Cercospora kikuchii]
MIGPSSRAWNALIRTHHIRSQKKVAKLRQAASAEDVYALIRPGAPGIMYVEGHRAGVENWTSAVSRLRYKDFHYVAKPAEMRPENDVLGKTSGSTGLHEAQTVKEFAAEMQARGVLKWFRKGMGYDEDPDRL